MVQRRTGRPRTTAPSNAPPASADDIGAAPGARDPGDAVPEGVPGPGRAAQEARQVEGLSADRDPGDAVPEGVAPGEPAPLTEEDQKVLGKLRDLPRR